MCVLDWTAETWASLQTDYRTERLCLRYIRGLDGGLHADAELRVVLVRHLLDVIDLAMWQLHNGLHGELVILVSQADEHSEGDDLHVLCRVSGFFGIQEHVQLTFFLPVVLHVVL
jgi:hypothetical protein